MAEIFASTPKLLYDLLNMTTLNKQERIRKWITIAVIGMLILLLLWFEYLYLPIGTDWTRCFRPATLEFIYGRSPYTNVGFFNPPWTLIPFIPFAILPERISSLLLVNIGLLSFLLIMNRLKIRLCISLLFLLFPTTLVVLHTVNIEWLVMLGLVLPPQIGLFFVLIKPQVGLAIAIYWFFIIPHKIKTFLPVFLATLISLAIYRDWFGKLVIRGNKMGYFGNFDISFFPYLVPLGLTLLFIAIRRHKDSFAYMSSPFLAPYIGANSYSILILGLCKLWSDYLHTKSKSADKEK